MTRLRIDLPAVGELDEADPLGWLLARIGDRTPAFAHGVLGMTAAREDEAIAIGLEDASRTLTVTPHPFDQASGGTVPIVPVLALAPPDPVALIAFLEAHWQRLDHVGINLAVRDLDEADWQRLVADVAAALPAYRLEIGAANDIVMIVAEDPAGGPAAVIELVHDRTAPFSSVHLCGCVDLDRAAVETCFPAPVGGYKPGDEAFFYSVALPRSLAVPAYLDLAFSDGGMASWPQIVQAMGRRIV